MLVPLSAHVRLQEIETALFVRGILYCNALLCVFHFPWILWDAQYVVKGVLLGHSPVFQSCSSDALGAFLADLHAFFLFLK